MRGRGGATSPHTSPHPRIPTRRRGPGDDGAFAPAPSPCYNRRLLLSNPAAPGGASRCHRRPNSRNWPPSWIWASPRRSTAATSAPAALPRGRPGPRSRPRGRPPMAGSHHRRPRPRAMPWCAAPFPATLRADERSPRSAGWTNRPPIPPPRQRAGGRRSFTPRGSPTARRGARPSRSRRNRPISRMPHGPTPGQPPCGAPAKSPRKRPATRPRPGRTRTLLPRRKRRRVPATPPTGRRRVLPAGSAPARALALVGDAAERRHGGHVVRHRPREPDLALTDDVQPSGRGSGAITRTPTHRFGHGDTTATPTATATATITPDARRPPCRRRRPHPSPTPTPSG